MTTFAELGVASDIVDALAGKGIVDAFPIQEQTIPLALSGQDIIGQAKTGTGKTFGFGLPIIQRLGDDPEPGVKALVVVPTRELCVQILDSFRTYGRHLRLSRAAVYGGVSQGPQVHNLARGLDVLVATPGRLLDLMNQGQVRFDSLEAFVLDEADRMLDMGFIVPVKRIVAKLPKERQTLLFSATMPQAVHGLVASLLKEPVRVEVTPVATTAERIAQRVHFVDKANKRALLQHLLADKAIARALVFARTKHGANKVAEQLDRAGVRTDAIHGNKSQNARQKALEDFRNGKVRVLVATDIAARGIDVDGITHVINFDLPNEPESYVHRIGRTARAGNDGIAISFCDAEERAFLRDIEKTIRQQVAVDVDHPFHAAHIADGVRHGSAAPAGQRGRGGNRGKPQRHGTDVSSAGTGRHPQRAGRSHDQHRGRHANGDQPHGRDMRKSGAEPEGRHQGSNGHRLHAESQGAAPRKHSHGRDGRRPDAGHDGGERHRGSNGHRQHAHGSEQRQETHRHGQRHESGKSAHGGQKAPGQRPHGQQHARQDNGGQQPLKRTHRGERNGGQAGGRSQRFEPVRMR